MNDSPSAAGRVDPGMAVVRVRGPDAARFLHAQLTSDVEALAPGEAALSAWCTPRGQVRNLFWIVRRRGGEAGFDLVAPAREADDLARRLRMFVLRAKAAVERVGDRVAGAAGPGAAALAAGWAGEAPASGRAVESGARVVFHPPGGPARFLAFGPDLDEPAPDGSPARWRRLEIAAGIAWLTDETRESFIPQMLDLDRLGAVSFDKGCYPGQEVVARARYLGRVKRRLHRGRVAAGPRPAPGDRLVSDERAAGRIVAAEREEGGEGYDLLAVIDVDRAAGRIEVEDGRTVAVAPTVAAATLADPSRT